MHWTVQTNWGLAGNERVLSVNPSSDGQKKKKLSKQETSPGGRWSIALGYITLKTAAWSLGSRIYWVHTHTHVHVVSERLPSQHLNCIGAGRKPGSSKWRLPAQMTPILRCSCINVELWTGPYLTQDEMDVRPMHSLSLLFHLQIPSILL